MVLAKVDVSRSYSSRKRGSSESWMRIISRSPSIHKYTPVIGWIIKNSDSCLTGGSGECVSERMNEWRWDEREQKKNQCKVAKEKPANLVLSAAFMDGDMLVIKLLWIFANRVNFCKLGCLQTAFMDQNKAHHEKKVAWRTQKKVLCSVNGNWYLGDQ